MRGERSEVNERANLAQKPLAGELNRHAGQLTGELNHHVGQLAGELNRHVVILARRAQPSRRSARWRAEPTCGCTRSASSYHHAGQLAGELNRRVVSLAGEFGRHASRLARRARPDPSLSDLLRLPYLPYSCDIRPSGPYTSRFVLIKVILEVL
ncbi:hypothetical protein DY000_02020183 [Brassica cretica]|uniref:Uncharacterized protein n=1 Tax=Brassica cretica TaxID=69181 RepID=A0ABQ7E6E4_BRACR|nr:hypothetical protein DY000_02020183 [Brassica cretica]